MFYLYVKTHNQTGLKYLGQTKQNPYVYRGSGKDWEEHIRSNGNNVSTEILLKTSNKSERNYWGRYYSRLWNIVGAQDDFGNKIWANKIPETGGGGNNDERIKLGTHNFLDSKSQSKNARKEQRRRVNAGTHNFLGGKQSIENNSKMLARGSHTSQIKASCIYCRTTCSINNIGKHHGDKCKKKPAEAGSTISCY